MQMRHWALSGHKAREAMANYFHRVEVRSEASHLQDYVDDHPFLGDHPRPSMSAAIKRCLCVPRCMRLLLPRTLLPRAVRGSSAAN